MITAYTTYRTAYRRNLRALLLSLTQGADKLCYILGMILRVDMLGNLHLHRGDWITASFAIDSAPKAPFADADGIAVYSDTQPDGEVGRCWSHSTRRSRRYIKT